MRISVSQMANYPVEFEDMRQSRDDTYINV